MLKSILENYQVSVQGKVLVHILQKIVCQIKNSRSWKSGKWFHGAAWGNADSCEERNRGFWNVGNAVYRFGAS